MLPFFPAHLFVRLAAVTHDVSRDMLLLNTQKYNEVARLLRDMEQVCVNVGLARTAKQIRAVIDACDSGRCPPARFQALVKPITGLLVEELAEFIFLAIPRNRVGFFQVPAGKKRKVSGADEAIREFHAARRCLGLGEPTACVLHLVRVIDFGAKAVARSLGINVQGLTIGAIAVEIQNSVRSLIKAGTCGVEMEQFYNALVTDLRAFARAYRNPAVHGFQNFTDQQANNLVITVNDFMGHLVANFGDYKIQHCRSWPWLRKPRKVCRTYGALHSWSKFTQAYAPGLISSASPELHLSLHEIFPTQSAGALRAEGLAPDKRRVFLVPLPNF